MTDDDWLDIGDEAPVAEPPPARVPVNRMALPSLHRELRTKRTALAIKHRRYLGALIKCDFHLNNAWRMYNGLGFRVDKATLTRWRQRKDVAECIEIAKRISEQELGLTEESVLAKAVRLADYGLDEVPVLDANGQPVIDPRTREPYTAVRDPKLALKATELLGKNKKLWGSDEDTTRVTVNIVDLSGQMAASSPPPLDGEFLTVEDEN